MARAYVLVECEAGRIKSASDALRELKGVELADATLGPYDVILRAEKPDVQAIMDFVTDEVQRVPGVEKTTTCLASQLG